MTTARNFGVTIVAAIAITTISRAQPNKFCSQTAQTLFTACTTDVTAESLVTKAVCANISDDQSRETCIDEMRDARDEGKEECKEQRDWRLEACEITGEDRYDPDISPSLFDDPKHPAHPNPYFPLQVGNRWEYLGGGERNTVEIVNETKRIEGVDCLVGRDLVFEDGELHEATDDWFCQAKDGTVWYFGEESKNYDTFEGDDPMRPELTSIGGSFKAGRDGAKPGILFLASPHVGDVYMEEFSLANAEDVSVILSTTYAYGQNPALDELVPQDLAERLCASGDCVVTRNFSLLEPGGLERKYYARGIGVFLEVEPEDGFVSQLVDCSFDARCHNLPQP